MEKIKLESKPMPFGVVVSSTIDDVLVHLIEDRKASKMYVGPGRGIKEHTHDRSLYFTLGVNLTVHGDVYPVPRFATVLIPKGMPHGWQHSGGERTSVVASYEPGHDTFETYEI